MSYTGVQVQMLAAALLGLSAFDAVSTPAAWGHTPLHGAHHWVASTKSLHSVAAIGCSGLPDSVKGRHFRLASYGVQQSCMHRFGLVVNVYAFLVGVVLSTWTSTLNICYWINPSGPGVEK